MRPEWGNRRICIECENPFYDMKKQVIQCPKCNRVHQSKELTKKPTVHLNNDIPDSIEDKKRLTFTRIGHRDAFVDDFLHPSLSEEYESQDASLESLAQQE